MSSQKFKDKKLVIIGPNASLNDELESRVKSSDFLVVINKGHRSEVFRQLRPFACAAVCSHCLDRNEDTGGGNFNAWELRKKGISMVLYPFNNKYSWDRMMEYHRSNYALLPLLQVSKNSYSSLLQTVPGFTPNTGYATIWMIAKSSCAELFVAGLDFLRLPYHHSYHQKIRNYQDAKSLVERYKVHNPDLDLESFRRLIVDHPIKVDSILADILSRPTERLFYQD